MRNRKESAEKDTGIGKPCGDRFMVSSKKKGKQNPTVVTVEVCS
jgi:hypothetical protein